MGSDTVTIIISSGIVSAIVTILIMLLSVGKYKEKVDRLCYDNDKVGDKLTQISEKLSNIEGGLERDRATNEYIKSKSPLSLTDKGKALLIDSTGKDYIDLKHAKFLKEIKSKNPKTPYDVQELSKDIISARTSLDEFNDIKDFAFSKGISINVILEVLGIYLRDLLLKDLKMSTKN